VASGRPSIEVESKCPPTFALSKHPSLRRCARSRTCSSSRRKSSLVGQTLRTMSKLERGFKSWAERVAGGVRRDLGLALYAPLPPENLARHLSIRLWTPHDVPGLPSEVLDQLLKHDPSGWSAVTQTVGELTTVIFNPRHSPGRRASNITHELAHVLLEHEPSRVILSTDGGIVMRTFDSRQEDEASWLSGCLLLPRVALLSAIRRGLSPDEIADEFGVSVVLVNYRTRITGAAVQASRGIRRRGRAASQKTARP
jgi:hypothetical protein